MFHRKLKTLHRALDRHVRQTALPTRGISRVRPPDLLLRQFAPVRVVLRIGLADEAVFIKRIDLPEVVGHVHDDHVAVRFRLQRSGPRVAVGIDRNVVVFIRKPLPEQPGAFIPKPHVAIRQCRPPRDLARPVERPQVGIGMIPRSALVADAVARAIAVVRRGVKDGQVWVVFDLRFHVRQPLLHDVWIGNTKFRESRRLLQLISIPLSRPSFLR